MTDSAARAPTPDLWIGLAAGLGAAALWAGGSVVSRYLSLAGLPPADLALLRYVGCLPIAVAVWSFYPPARPRIPARRLAALLLLAGPPYQALLLAGYGHANAGAGALVVTGLMPLAACVLARWWSTTRPAREKWAGASIAVAGVWIFSRDLAAADLDMTGVLVFASAAVMWALLGTLVGAWRIDPAQLTVALGLWSPVFVPVWWIVSPGSLPDAPLPNLVLQMLYHGVVVAFVATFLFFVAVRSVGPEAAGCLQAATPGFAAVIGMLMLAEPLGLAQAAGALVCMLGLAIGVDGNRVATTGAALRSGTAKAFMRVHRSWRTASTVSAEMTAPRSATM